MFRPAQQFFPEKIFYFIFSARGIGGRVFGLQAVASQYCHEYKRNSLGQCGYAAHETSTLVLRIQKK
jgi:hypothetical protein